MGDKTDVALRYANIIELNDEELRERLRPAYEAMKAEKFAKGGYITYYDPEVCPTTAHAVHEYSGRKQLMWMNESYEEHLINVL